MGACLSVDAKDESAVKDRAIEKQIKSEIAEKDQTIKMLLLGTGESGKSTLVKQMRIIHSDNFNEGELFDFKKTVRENSVEAIKLILEQMTKLNIEFGAPDTTQAVTQLGQLPTVISDAMVESAAGVMAKIWADSGVQAAYARRNEYYMLDSGPYFLESIGRIFDITYMPTQQDIVRTRVRTTGMVETKFKYRDIIFRMVDVGGQRSERRKWVQCFGDVNAVIFVADIAAYNQRLFEDATVNRLDEALQTFQGIANNRYFDDSAVILFLNKTDLFDAKLKEVPFNTVFPRFKGNPTDPDDVKKYLVRKFLEQFKRSQNEKKIYYHFTCATDTENVKVILGAVTDSIVQANLRSVGLI
ncbi:guanine nucleotide-binding protein G(I) [Capsaspora owczarzaki ATCC 30864]|uniref:Guanine nucleotide-binding protein G(I) n=1 Tax=Capsaspora owczarzaki (strain ATCC 30864) TaxID=595528 RepID=A0A0D2VU46_CAPO3|nr:guanine nucleotide-binding protein G(I) [Capsaspora owczarzaki ATCC 30864]KJE94887.1 guanine nucleotide-binding protein G(I) [Capsaspora owczarzaki ATCC 30864]|eukprot:XP_004346119.2 guanine nucleotide-binding protein G(I) [Capsaspora owczarzaki ATCC 30864]